MINLAEVAAAFTGFSGIVATISRRGSWPEIALFRFQNLLAISVGLIFLSILPVIFNAYQISGGQLWRACCATLAVFVVAFLAFRTPVAYRLTDSGAVDKYGKLTGRTFLVTLSAILLLQLSGIFGLFESGFALFLTGLIGLLFLAALQFALLAMFTISERA